MTSVINRNSNSHNIDSDIDSIESYDTTQVTEDDSYSQDSYDNGAYSEDALRQAYSDVYDTPLDTSTVKENDMTSIEPNKDFKDENGDDICGAVTL